MSDDCSPVIVTRDPYVLVVSERWTAPGGGTGLTWIIIERTAAETIALHEAVTVDDDGELVPASKADPTHRFRPMWLSLAAGPDGDDIEVLAVGQVSDVTWSWTPGVPVVLGDAGALTQTPVTTSGEFACRLGYAVDATTILFDPAPAILVA